MNLENALGHIGAYLEGGDEAGIVSEADAAEAYDVICSEIAKITAERDSLSATIEATRATAAGSDTQAAIMATLRSLQYSAPENKPALLFHKLIAPLQAQIGESEQTTAAYAREAASLRAEAGTLRLQLAECQADASNYLRAQNMKLRRVVQLFELQLSAAEDERDTLRRQLAASQGKIAADKIAFGKCAAEIEATHRQLAECRAEREHEIEITRGYLANVEAQNADLRRQLAEVPRNDIAQLYDAYAYATAGWEPGTIESFPAVFRYLIDTQGAE